MTSELIAYGDLSTDFQRVEQAMVYLQSHYPEQPTLAQVAASVGLSEYHFQRLFTHWVGISPKRFLQFLTKEHARELLDHSASVLEAAYQSGSLDRVACMIFLSTAMRSRQVNINFTGRDCRSPTAFTPAHLGNVWSR